MASNTLRPQALDRLPQITSDKRSPQQDTFVNRVGLLTSIGLGLATAVAIVRYAMQSGTDQISLLTNLLLVALFVFALLPRAVIRKMGEFRDVGALKAFAKKYGLALSQNNSHGEYNRLALGTVEELPTALMFRSSQTSWHTSHTRLVVPCRLRFEGGTTTPLDVTWHPKVGTLGRVGLPAVSVRSEHLDESVDTLGPTNPTTLVHARLLALLGEDVQKLLTQVVRKDAVITLKSGRLELWLNKVDSDLPGLEVAFTKLKRLRERLVSAASGPLPERLLFLVMNSKPDFRDQCLDSLRTHFPNSEEYKRAERFLENAGGGHLSLASEEGQGGLALVNTDGGMALAEEEIQEAESQPALAAVEIEP